MAVASRSAPSDARVPCPQCGGLVHPIAGKCKHCKVDLAALRVTTSGPRSAAAAPLPRIRAETPAPVTAVEPALVEDEPAAPAYNPVPIPAPRGSGVRTHERGWFARNWPVLVIVLASLAIILAVVLMVLPADEVADRGTRSRGGPAPERMETDPLPQQGDPWSNGNQGAAPQPPDPAPAPPAPAPDDTDDDLAAPQPADPLSDPFASPRAVPPPQLSPGMALVQAISKRLCEKAKQCGDPSVASLCDVVDIIPTTPLPANCPQAQTCLRAIDKVDVCNGSMAGGVGGPDFMALMSQVTECAEAVTRC